MYAMPSSPKSNLLQPQKRIDGPVGVGGWLLFYCVGLTIVVPLLTFIGVKRNLQEYFEMVGLVEFPEFHGNLSLIKGFCVGSAILSLCVVIPSIYIGIRLWQTKPGSVRLVKGILIYNLILHLFSIGLEYIAYKEMVGILETMLAKIREMSFSEPWARIEFAKLTETVHDFSKTSTIALIRSSVLSILGFGIWFTYFSRSRRVKNTFPESATN